MFIIISIIIITLFITAAITFILFRLLLLLLIIIIVIIIRLVGERQRCQAAVEGLERSRPDPQSRPSPARMV